MVSAAHDTHPHPVATATTATRPVSGTLTRANRHVAAVTARLLLTLVVAIAIAVPVGGYIYAHHLVLLGARVSTPAVTLPPAAQASYSTFAAHGPSTFVVLSYDDLTTHLGAGSTTKAGKTVSATAFATQLAMLRAAGFVSVTGEQLTQYLDHATPLPPHSVLITFDGGRERDWTVADGLLARYGYTAVAFLNPSRLAGRGSGYLSWTQLAQMTSSGRWTVALDPSDDTASVPTDASGTPGPALLEHAWLPDADRAETTAEFQSRIRAGLHAQIDQLTAHGLTAPRLVMYPFDSHYPLSRATTGFDQLSEVVNSEFDAGLLRMSPDATVTDFYRGERLLPVLQVFSTTTTDGLFGRIESAT
jgi:biofilm PGA synthesis lipoprotein PgaB